MKTVAVILGAGQGTRIKGASIPKQFIKLHGAPMIVQTVEKFALINEIEKVLIVVSKPWMSHAKDIFRDNQFYKKWCSLRAEFPDKNRYSKLVNI